MKFPFSHIRISDVRYDTGKIGFIPYQAFATSNATLYSKLAFRKGTANTIEDYYNTYYANAFSRNNIGLHVFIKKFWFSSTSESKSQANAVSVNFEANAKFHIKWELYLFKNDEYLAFRRIDTTLDFNKSARELLISKDEANASVSALFNSIFNNLIEQFTYERAVAEFENKTKKSLQELRTMYEKRFLLPVLKDTCIKDGVFINFNEFENNQPSIRYFREKQAHYRTSVKSKQIVDSADSPIRNYWAYSMEGETTKSGFGNSKIHRLGNTFEYFIRIGIGRVRTPTSIFFPVDDIYWVPYQIDMETGESY